MALRADPAVLVVDGEAQRLLLLEAAEALEVVQGGVDEVPELLLLRPAARLGTQRRGGAGDAGEPLRPVFDQATEVLDGVGDCWRERHGPHASGRGRGDSAARDDRGGLSETLVRSKRHGLRRMTAEAGK
jgi:hypothetical protein